MINELETGFTYQPIGWGMFASAIVGQSSRLNLANATGKRSLTLRRPVVARTSEIQLERFDG
jgi:hypothetical protein